MTPDTSTFEITAIRCEELFIPNMFTPNNDGYNDNFNIIAEGFTNYHMLVLNRWGEKIFESHQENLLWDGYSQAGIQAPDGTYYYIFSANDYTNKTISQKGFITLIR